MSISMGETRLLNFDFNETDLLAGTSAELIAPVSGWITKMDVIIQKAVTTGGAITVLTGDAGAVTVAGLTVTVADAAAKGVRYSDRPTSDDATTTYVTAGDRIQVVPAAAFATAGAARGFLTLNTGNHYKA